MENQPQIPTLKDSKKPPVRIKGMGVTTLRERLKQFKKKDLAFILSGLGVLFMAPLAEHFMLNSDNAGAGSFKPGWGFQSSGRFGDGSSPYEGGINGLAPGGVAGGGDVITPLNVRDPSGLIMAPGAQQQPPATAVTAPAAGAAPKESSDWKDAIANAASQGAKAATKAASLPMVKPALASSALHGLSAGANGSGSTYSLPPISASHAPGSAEQSRSLSRVIQSPGFAGLARGPQDGSGGSLEALKKAAANAGADFNRQGSASSALESAANRNIPGGDTSGGGGASGGSGGTADKGQGGNGGGHDGKSLGESLAFLAEKDWQQKMRDLAYEVLKKKTMFPIELQQDLEKDAAKQFETAAVKWFMDLGKDKSKNLLCHPKDSTDVASVFIIDDSTIDDDCGNETAKEATPKKKFCKRGGYIFDTTSGNYDKPIVCGPASDDDTKTKTKKTEDNAVGGVASYDNTPNPAPGVNPGEVVGTSGQSLNKMCRDYKKTNLDSLNENEKTMRTQLNNMIGYLNVVSVILEGYPVAAECGVDIKEDDNAQGQVALLRKLFIENIQDPGKKGAVYQLQETHKRVLDTLTSMLGGPDAPSSGMISDTDRIVNQLSAIQGDADMQKAITDAQTAYQGTIKEALNAVKGDGGVNDMVKLSKDKIKAIRKALKELDKLDKDAQTYVGKLNEARGQYVKALEDYRLNDGKGPQAVKEKQQYLDDFDAQFKPFQSREWGPDVYNSMSYRYHVALAKAKDVLTNKITPEVKQLKGYINGSDPSLQAIQDYTSKIVSQDTENGGQLAASYTWSGKDVAQGDINKVCGLLKDKEKKFEETDTKPLKDAGAKINEEIQNIPVGTRWWAQGEGGQTAPWGLRESGVLGTVSAATLDQPGSVPVPSQWPSVDDHDNDDDKGE